MPRGILLVFTVGIFGYLPLGGAASADTEPAPGVLGGGFGVALEEPICAVDSNGSALPVLKRRPVLGTWVDSREIGFWIDSGGIGGFIDPRGLRVDPRGIGLRIGPHSFGGWLDPSGIGFMIDPTG